MTPATLDLFRAIVNVDLLAVQRALATGADVNSTDELGRSVLAYAALGNAVNVVGTATRPRLSEQSLDILRVIAQHPDLSLYSLNAPMPWAGGVTLLGLMSWLNMPSEIMCLLDYAAGLLEVNAMDEQGATPLMYAARDGRLKVVQRLLAHGARPDLKDVSQRSAIQYALAHSRILWLCEESLRRSREKRFTGSINTSFGRRTSRQDPCPESQEHAFDGLFYHPQHPRLIRPPPKASFDNVNLRNTFDTLLRAVRAGNLSTLRMMLFSSSPNDGSQTSPVSPVAPLLVNFRDSAGLTLAHHAVSRRCPSIAILDALYLAGCDVGLFSTLGFTPLHHLARTARDELEGSKHDEEVRHPSPTVQTQRLYTYTMHIVRDLHAPLGATDSRGETPLHAAAEHGRSLSVLQAMLDYDSKFTGKGAVREARNERGLRPVDVARPEFIPLFVVHRQTITRARSTSQLLPPSAPLGNASKVKDVLPCSLSRSVCQQGLARKESNGSFASELSGGSSTSSDRQTHGLCLSQSTRRSPQQSTVQCSPTEALPSPVSDVFPAVRETHVPVDISTCAHDVLHHLSLSAAALYGFAQQRSGANADEAGSLRELSEVSNTLLFTRNLASHVLDYWAARLESAREDSEWARRALGQTEVLLRRMGGHVGSVSKLCDLQRVAGSGAGATSVGTGAGPPPPCGVCLRDAGVQTDVDAGHEDCADLRAESGEVVDETSSVVVPGAELACDAPNKTLQARVEQRRALASEDTSCAIGREVKPPPLPLPPPLPPSPSSPSSSTGLSPSDPPGSRASWLDIAPRTLQRAARDLRDTIEHFITLQQSFLRAVQSLEQARALVLGSIQSREDRLEALLRDRRDLSVSGASTQLPAIQEQTHDVDEERFESKASVSTVIIAHAHNPGPPALELESPGESQLLRRVLIRKLAKRVENVFENLQKIHLWLRIIREVLRGLKQRALLDQ